MKKILSILLLMGLVFGSVNVSYAQKETKKERKDRKKKEKVEKKLWKAKAKNYKKSPLSLRDDLENVNKQLKELSAKNKELMKRLAACNSAIDSLEAINRSKVNELAALNAKYEKLQVAYEASKNVVEKNIIPGLVYKVQIGAFVHFDITSYLKDTGESFEGENRDGMNKYTMGNFREYEVAEAFKKDVQKMGIKDAWVTPIIDGKRVTHEEARQYISRQGG